MKKNPKIYVVYDTINEEIMIVASAKNEKMAVRNLYGSVGSFAPIKDMKLYEVGEINEENFKIKSGKAREIAWDIYEFPNSKAECLMPKGTIEENKDAFEKACEEKKKEGENK